MNLLTSWEVRYARQKEMDAIFRWRGVGVRDTRYNLFCRDGKVSIQGWSVETERFLIDPVSMYHRPPQRGRKKVEPLWKE